MNENSEEWITKVPRDRSGHLELLFTKPPYWEYLLFGTTLLVGLERAEPKWRDFQLGYSMMIGERIDQDGLLSEIDERFSRAMAIASNGERVVSQHAQLAAFGEPGHPGDVALIEHMGNRLITMYEQLLDWASEFRSLRLPERASRLPDMGAAFVAQPINAIRQFVIDFVSSLEKSLTKLAAGSDEHIQITMHLTFDLDSKTSKTFLKELKRATR
ncbi:MAG: hypothetical protein ACREX3_05030 [Gammaproteobacteria bacterium]